MHKVSVWVKSRTMQKQWWRKGLMGEKERRRKREKENRRFQTMWCLQWTVQWKEWECDLSRWFKDRLLWRKMDWDCDKTLHIFHFKILLFQLRHDVVSEYSEFHPYSSAQTCSRLCKGCVSWKCGWVSSLSVSTDHVLLGWASDLWRCRSLKLSGLMGLWAARIPLGVLPSLSKPGRPFRDTKKHCSDYWRRISTQTYATHLLVLSRVDRVLLS